MNEQIMMCPCNDILLSNKIEWNIDTDTQQGRIQNNYSKWMESDQTNKQTKNL